MLNYVYCLPPSLHASPLRVPLSLSRPQNPAMSPTASPFLCRQRTVSSRQNSDIESGKYHRICRANEHNSPPRHTKLTTEHKHTTQYLYAFRDEANAFSFGRNIFVFRLFVSRCKYMLLFIHPCALKFKQMRASILTLLCNFPVFEMHLKCTCEDINKIHLHRTIAYFVCHFP